MNDLVSIIMPNYNCEKYLDETINSVINQTYSNWELIVVDDKSTDKSVEIISSYSKNDSRIHLVVNDVNSGAAFSRNKAISMAKGKFISFLDSDDLWKKDKLEKQIRFMINNNIGFSYSYYDRINENSEPLNMLITGPKKIGKYKMFRYNYIGCLTVIYDSEKVGLISINPDLKSRNDYAMWLKVIKKTKCYLFAENMASYRVRRGTLSHSGIKKSIKNQYKLYRISEKMNPINSLIHTFRNLFWGYLKKITYSKKIK